MSSASLIFSGEVRAPHGAQCLSTTRLPYGCDPKWSMAALEHVSFKSEERSRLPPVISTRIVVRHRAPVQWSGALTAALLADTPAFASLKKALFDGKSANERVQVAARSAWRLSSRWSHARARLQSRRTVATDTCSTAAIFVMAQATEEAHLDHAALSGVEGL
jgi:hypothetical protein